MQKSVSASIIVKPHFNNYLLYFERLVLRKDKYWYIAKVNRCKMCYTAALTSSGMTAYQIVELRLAIEHSLLAYS